MSVHGHQFRERERRDLDADTGNSLPRIHTPTRATESGLQQSVSNYSLLSPRSHQQSQQLLPHVPSSSSVKGSLHSQQHSQQSIRPLSARSLPHNSVVVNESPSRIDGQPGYSSSSVVSGGSSSIPRSMVGKDFVAPGQSMPFGPKKKKKRRKIPLMLQLPPGEAGQSTGHGPHHAVSYDDDEPNFSVSMNLKKVSSEDFYLGMLGHKNLICEPDEEKPHIMLYREEMCNCCGVIHPNPAVMDCYGLCPLCFSELRPTRSLRERWKNVKALQPLEILFATYGDPEDLTTCKVVTEQCQELVAKNRDKDRIAFVVKESVIDIFEGYDPGKGKNKQIRVRYRVNTEARSGVLVSQHGCLVLDFDAKGRIPQPFVLLAQKSKFLRLYDATYGHPKGSSKTGRMSYDVLEILQSLVDQNGGSFLSISAMTPLTRLFGDPCPGYTKDLRINFEIVGRGGQVTVKEVRGHLLKRINIVSAPTISPIIFVISATYGITPTARRDRLDLIAKQLATITAIEHRRREGITITPEEMLLCKQKTHLLELRETFQQVQTKFFDISVKVQKIVDKQKTTLILNKEEFDPNAVFGNPLIGFPKILEIYVDCQGHDSEKVTQLNEVMDTGYTRNLITMKKGRFNIVVEDDKTTGKGIMQESLNFIAEYSAPMIIVTKAMYGELDDLTKLIDVTHDVQGIVEGNTLIIEQDVDLNKCFKIDPSPGRQKQLQIKYITRGFTGNLRVREKNDLFVAGIELGYPPIPPPDDENHEMHY